DLAALLRHSDLEDRLKSLLPKPASSSAPGSSITVTSLPAQLDRLYNTRLPNRIRREQALPGNRDDWPGLGAALKHVDAWLNASKTAHRLSSWGTQFRRILGDVYGSRTLHLENADDEVMHRTILRLMEECDRLGGIPEALDTISLSAEDAFEIALAPLSRESL